MYDEHLNTLHCFSIPKDIRDELKMRADNAFAVASPFEDTVALKKIKSPLMKENLELLKEVEEAWEEIKRGEYTEYESEEEFLKALDKWVKSGEL